MRRWAWILGVVFALVGAWAFGGFSVAPPAFGQSWGGGMMGPGGMMGGPGGGWGGQGYQGYGMGPGMMGGYNYNWYGKKFTSTGEQIYYTGSSPKTGPIPRSGGPMWVYHGSVGCITCHGVRGRGGVPVMMGTAIPSDIQYAVLTGKVPEPSGEQMDHPPYTDATIKQAITQGVDPGGKPLDWTMPRWQMTEEDQSDLLAYLKTLK